MKAKLFSTPEIESPSTANGSRTVKAQGRSTSETYADYEIAYGDYKIVYGEK